VRAAYKSALSATPHGAAWWLDLSSSWHHDISPIDRNLKQLIYNDLRCSNLAQPARGIAARVSVKLVAVGRRRTRSRRDVFRSHYCATARPVII